MGNPKRSLFAKNITTKSTSVGDGTASRRMLKANPHWRRPKYKNMFLKNDSLLHENEAVRGSVRQSDDFKKNMTSTYQGDKKTSRGYLSRRDEEKYKDYLKSRKQGIESYANEDNRDKRNGIPKKNHVLQKRALNASVYNTNGKRNKLLHWQS